MTKHELIKAVHEKTGMSKTTVGQVLDTALAEIQCSLARGESVALVGFGTFEARQRAAREALNPRNGERIAIEAKRVPAFRAGKTLKAATAGK